MKQVCEIDDFSTSVRRIKTIVDSGKIGEIQYQCILVLNRIVVLKHLRRKNERS
jgi:hypothetical protein